MIFSKKTFFPVALALFLGTMSAQIHAKSFGARVAQPFKAIGRFLAHLNYFGNRNKIKKIENSLSKTTFADGCHKLYNWRIEPYEHCNNTVFWSFASDIANNVEQQDAVIAWLRHDLEHQKVYFFNRCEKVTTFSDIEDAIMQEKKELQDYLRTLRAITKSYGIGSPEVITKIGTKNTIGWTQEKWEQKNRELTNRYTKNSFLNNGNRASRLYWNVFKRLERLKVLEEIILKPVSQEQQEQLKNDVVVVRNNINNLKRDPDFLMFAHSSNIDEDIQELNKIKDLYDEVMSKRVISQACFDKVYEKLNNLHQKYLVIQEEFNSFNFSPPLPSSLVEEASIGSDFSSDWE